MKTKLLSILLVLLMMVSVFALSACNMEGMEGPEGPKGEQGEPGEDGKDGVGIRGISLVRSTGLVDTYLITYTDGSTSTFTVTNGADGKDGVNGEDGKDGLDGTPGQDGEDGKDGAPGQDGEDGKDGKDGVGIASAEVNADGELVLHFTNGSALNLGKVVGSNGKDGADGEDGKDGADGTNGADGKDGQDGADGKDGVGIADVAIVEGRLVLTLSNGTVIDLGNIKGEDGKDGADGEDGKDGVNGTDGKDGINGKDGISIVKSEINANGELVLTYSDGNSTNLGKVVGTNGKDGADGEDGKDGVDGVGISTVVINEKHELVITLSNGTVINLGNIKGEKGDKGDKGETGEQGPQGDKGETGEKGDDGITPLLRINDTTNEWEVSYNNGETWISLGVVATGPQGSQGETGDKGETGDTGVGIEKVEFDENGDLVITFTDGTTQTVEMPEKSEHTHTYGAWLVYGEATDNCENNIYYVVCSECNHVDFKKGDADRHVWNGWYSSDSSYHWFGCANCEEIKEHTAHVYDNDCDVDCNVCGADRTAFAHVYDSDVCDVDCNVCGAVRVDPHVWDSACDAECDRCGEVRKVPDHVYDNACDANCNVCGGARVPADHVYDDEFDAVCNVCGERREVPYTWGLEYALDPDETGYMVIGLGEATDSVIVIPETHNGLPVTMIRGRAFYGRYITSVTIPDSVTAIGGYAFSNCNSLTSVEIGDGVTTIGEHAFYYCTSLTSVVIGDSVTSIGVSAFVNCHSLTSVVIGDSVTSIGSYAFEDCSSLVSVVIGDSVTSIGDRAFQDCDSLTSVVIGSGASDINSAAFLDCTALTSITVDEDNATYKSIDGNLYSKDGKTLVRYAIGKTSASFIVPKEVEVIGNYAFEDAPNLVRIIFQDNLKTIRDFAFSSCYSLMEVCYTGSKAEWDNVSIGSSGNDAIKNASFTFNYCIHEYSGDCDVVCNKCGKERVTLVEHTVVVDEAVAATCTETGLTEGSHCSVCAQVLVEQVVVDALGHNYVDGNCEYCGLTSDEYFTFTLLDDDTYSIKAKDVNNMPSEVVIPSTYNGKAVTVIDERAFTNCSNLVSITIPDTVTKIEIRAFNNCVLLESLIIPENVSEIKNWAFNGCTNLRSIVMPNCATTASSAFLKCTSLDFKEYGNALYLGTKDNPYAYLVMETSTDITSCTLHEDTIVICNSALINTLIESITFNDKLEIVGENAFGGCKNLKYVHINSLESWCNISFNANLTTFVYNACPGAVGASLYVNGDLITDLIIPDTVTSIKPFAFAFFKDITSLTIPDSVTSIGDYGFGRCDNIQRIEIGSGVVNIGTLFGHLSNLSEVTISDDNDTYKIVDNNIYTKDGKTLVHYAEWNTSTSFVIPDGVEHIDSYAFLNCESLTSVVIPNSVTSIGDYAFRDCSSLASVTIPDSVTSIGFYAFYNCSSLESVTIPDSVTSIGDYAFEYCTSLVSVTIPDSVTSIGGSAFSYCRSLVSVTIPDSVTSIGSHAFYNCSSLTDVYYTGTEEKWAAITIDSGNKNLTNATIHYNYVPEE